MSDKAFPNKRLKRQREVNGWTRSYVAGKIECMCTMQQNRCELAKICAFRLTHCLFSGVF